MFIASARAFGFWLDSLLVMYTSVVVLSFFIMESSGSNVGLAITQAMGLTGMVQWGMRQSAELENTMTAVERVIEYRTVDPEPQINDSDNKKLTKTWPESGNIEFNNLSLSYAPDKVDKVLHDLNLQIKAGEKVGIVGRTGAGKSSCLSALFRLSYLDGKVIIDGIDTQTISLETLRSKISVIPQEPVLFSASMRYNLDPFDEYPDEKLWSALEEVKLRKTIAEMPAGLNTKVAEGGSNFSIGEKQLVCLARAILRDNKILLMDEATANVDPETDALIQSTIRDKFHNCTVLTIAHRLSTVIDYDKILVMDAGKCVEFASPYDLLHGDENGVFYKMVLETGLSSFKRLKNMTEMVRKT
jgi:ATP-binding cassette, subfamily C (CFTR/MRP), member 4